MLRSYNPRYLVGTLRLSFLHCQQEGMPGLRTDPASPSGEPPPHGWLYKNRINVALALLACGAVLATIIHLITPVLAKSLAEGIPASWIRTSSEKLLRDLDNTSLKPSATPLAEQAALQERFSALTAPPEGAPPYVLVFRHSTRPGSTLMALPGGEIIVTDEFLRSIPDHNEQLALLCHELGHLYFRHALRSAIEGNLYLLASAAFIGSSENSINALSAGLHKSSYTLDYVLEADHYALSMLNANNLPPGLLSLAIRHGEAPLKTGQLDQDPLSHRNFFKDRMEALAQIRSF
jgi:Zn-dependent protease with chaperone function